MKHCPNCDAELLDEAVLCPYCGTDVENKSQKPSKLAKIALVFMFVTIGAQLLTFGIQLLTVNLTIDAYLAEGLSLQLARSFAYTEVFSKLVPLAWVIPMTVSLAKKVKNNDVIISTGFKVCTLLFVNIVSGILLLCMKAED